MTEETAVDVQPVLRPDLQLLPFVRMVTADVLDKCGPLVSCSQKKRIDQIQRLINKTLAGLPAGLVPNMDKRQEVSQAVMKRLQQRYGLWLTFVLSAPHRTEEAFIVECFQTELKTHLTKRPPISRRHCQTYGCMYAAFFLLILAMAILILVFKFLSQ